MNCAFRIATASAALVVAAACSDGPVTSNRDGTTQIVLTDSPFPYDFVSRVDIHVVSVAVSRTADTGASAESQEWVTVAAPDRVFDLLALQRGATALLGEVELPAAEYPALRMVINTDLSSITWHTGDRAPVSWQNVGEITLHALVEGALQVPEAGGRIVIDFDVGRSFLSHSAPNPGFLFIPWIRAVNEATTGGLSGTVYGWTIEGESAPLPGGSVAVFLGDPAQSQIMWRLVASAPIDPLGHYEVHYLAAASYLVQASAPAGFELATGTAGPIPVAAGVNSSVDLQLERGDGGSGGAFLRVVGDTSLAVGESQTFFAAIFDAQGDSVFTNEVGWGSSDPAVASVTPGSGASQWATVTGHAEGLAVIMAVSGGLSDSAIVRVGDTTTTAGGPVTTVEVLPATQTVAVGDSAYVEAVLRDAEGRTLVNRAITWSVSRPNVIRVDAQFGNWLLFTGLAADTVTVTATSEGKSGSASVTVAN